MVQSERIVSNTHINTIQKAIGLFGYKSIIFSLQSVITHSLASLFPIRIFAFDGSVQDARVYTCTHLFLFHSCQIFFFQFIKVFLNSRYCLQSIYNSIQLGVICKFAKCTLCPRLEITNEDVKQYWTKDRP